MPGDLSSNIQSSIQAAHVPSQTARKLGRQRHLERRQQQRRRRQGWRRRQRQLRCGPGASPGNTANATSPSRVAPTSPGSINGGNTDSYGNNGGDVDNDNKVDVDVDNGNDAESGDAKGANGGYAGRDQPGTHEGDNKSSGGDARNRNGRPVPPTAGTAATVARRPRPVDRWSVVPAAMLLRPNSTSGNGGAGSAGTGGAASGGSGGSGGLRAATARLLA